MKETREDNPLGTEPVGQLLRKFTVPSIISMLVGSLYNIVDQFFIGQKIGELGNAATNISFPLNTLCIATALIFGVGGASAFNLAMGEGHSKKAVRFMGNAASMLFLSGVVITLVTLFFLRPLMLFFGSPDNAGRI